MSFFTIPLDEVVPKQYICLVGRKIVDEELQAAQKRLLKLSLMTYEELLVGEAKDEVKKSVADKVFEMHGLLGKTTDPNLNVHFAIPPEYFGEVFRGLRSLTEAASPALPAPAAKPAEDADFQLIEDEEELSDV